MSVRYLIVLVFFVVSYSYGQVGIGTTNPSASLDIQSSSQTTPSNTDGLLIPKIDEFPYTAELLPEIGRRFKAFEPPGKAELLAWWYLVEEEEVR